jgi:hypothetical protein
MVFPRPIRLLFLAASLSYGGCSGQKGDLVSVEGVVTLDGQSMSGVRVIFDQPELGPNENIGYAGRTDEQGRYVLRPLGRDRAGVPPGTYRVSLTTVETVDPSRDDSPMTPERVPPAYRGGRLSFTVPEGGTDQANFELKSKGL